MRKVWMPLAALCIFGGTFFACGDLENGPFSPEFFDEQDLIGTWNALKDEFTDNSDPFEKFDQITSADVDSILLIFTSNGELRHKTVFQNSFFTLTLDYRVSNDTLYWIFGDLEVPYVFSFEKTFEGNILRLTNRNVFYDFDGDGTSESATEVVDLEKL